MRIGMMLRAFDEFGGVGVYAQNVTHELLEIDRDNEYVLLYRSAKNLGRFSHHPNVTEVVVRAPNLATWDQVAVPWVCWKNDVDVIFHPKFTVPLMAHCKTVMVVHGADWFIPEHASFYKPLDVQYVRAFMPLYFDKASLVLSVSQITTDNFIRILGLPSDKIRTTYFGPAKNFRRITDPKVLAEVRQRYELPERFILTLTKVGGDTRKNFGNIHTAYRTYHERAGTPHKLVVGGKGCDVFRGIYGIPMDGYGADVEFPGWIDQKDLPAVFSMAGLYLYTSNLEAFPIPVTEAMTCGTPIVTSAANGLEEIAGDAAVLVDPGNPEAIADAVDRVLSDSGLQADLSAKGMERSKLFTWEKCARKTLALLEGLA